MKVMLLDRFSYSGRFNHVLSLAGELNRQGQPASVLATDLPEQAKKLYRDHFLQAVATVNQDFTHNLYMAIRSGDISLIHLHSLQLLPQVIQLLPKLKVKLVVTVHEGEALSYLQQLPQEASLLTTSPGLLPYLKRTRSDTAFVADGINLEQYRPAAKDGFKVVFIGEQGGFTRESYKLLLKAIGLTSMSLEIICPERPQVITGRYHGWLPDSSPILSGSQLIIGRGRALLEGMACGNAVLVMGQSYRGILSPQDCLPSGLPDLSGAGSKVDCYRTIYYDLSRLWKDRVYLRRLQDWGRKLVRENYDLRLAAEEVAFAYQSALSRKKNR